MQFLHLNHILTVYTDGDEEVYNDVIKAKVVLPKELFRVNNASSTPILETSRVADLPVASVPKVAYNDKKMKFAEATLQLQENKNLSAVLENLEKNYRKEYQNTYKDALTTYEREVAPARKEYQNRLAELEYQKQLYIDSGNKEELARLPYIPAPELPEFDFQFRPEIQAETLLSNLNEEHIFALSRVLATSELVSVLSDISSFNELFQSISQNNQQLQQQILSNTILNQQVSTNIGGMIVPVNNNTSTLGNISFSLKTFGRSLNEWSLLLVLNSNEQIVSANYKITTNTQELGSSSVYCFVGGSHLLFDLPRILVPLLSPLDQFILSGTVTLSDGNSYNFMVTLYKDINDLDRLTKNYNFTGTGGLQLIKNNNPSEVSENTMDAFIPSGFGMKNIGITDYKKVEQSTYCYVEGDVAHIENIMAREYKERATRRLKRNESQTTKSSESEKEKLSDTTSTERHEMQSEVAKILQESKDFAAQAGFSAKWGTSPAAEYVLNVSANYATHNSKEESNRQAVTEAKDITARALDRIVTKVKEERIDKILEEYEENNKHGFDNTKGSNHVVGVYRWVDKVVKNQIYNYGKRMMFEFMIPEPAKLHSLGMKISKNTENQLIKPVDPRESNVQKLENFSSLEDETKLKFWLSKYNVEIDDRPDPNITLGKGFSFSGSNPNTLFFNDKDVLTIPDGFVAKQAKVWLSGMEANLYGRGLTVSVGDLLFGGFGFLAGGRTQESQIISFRKEFRKSISISAYSCSFFTSDINVVIYCELSQEAKNAWLQKAFNKIIEAYEVEMEKYNQALAEAKALGVQIKGSNPGFYRKIENTILRRNCISYMLNQNPSVELTFGKNKYYNNGYSSGEDFLNTDIKVDKTLDQYAAFVKFMEQAFEWEIMSYYFYPYYWGNRADWDKMYQFDDNDPTFRAFMQSGMARVIVTVRPGFEETVRHFLATGQIWNGGEVPVLDDPLFLSIVDEMRSPKATKEGEPWREKIPTSLTILQADSIGLKVEKALPCNCEPGVKFDDNLGEMCGSNFELNQNQIGQSADKWMEISFNQMDKIDLKTIKDFDTQGYFPKKFECMGNEITIDRDANWNAEDSVTKVYKALADEISQIEGVEAYPTAENGITFKINVSKIKKFTFTKPGGAPQYDTLSFSTDGISYLKIVTPEYGMSSSDKILDKNGQLIPQVEYLDKVPLSKFLV